MGSQQLIVDTQTSSSSVVTMNTLLLLSLIILLTGSQASPSPKERLKVKYKIRTGTNGDVEKQKITEEILRSEAETLNNLVEIEREEADVVNNYRSLVTGVIGQLERAARAQDLTIGDLVFDIVKEVVAETISGLFSRGLGLGTARNGGENFSFFSTIMNAVTKVASGSKSC